MRLVLTEREPPGSWLAGPFEPSAAPAVGRLLQAAYRGTIDDEGETESDAVAEVDRVLAGAYGPFVASSSFLVDEGDRVAGASMVTSWEEKPYLAHLVVHPDVQRRGLGMYLMTVTGNALFSAGHSSLELMVTEANEPAVALYRKLGFKLVGRLTEPPSS